MSETTQRELAPHTPLNSMQFVLAGDSTPANPDIRERIQAIRNQPVKATFDAKHLHAIHNRLYEDRNLTAGRLRGTHLLPDGTRLDERAAPARELADSERTTFARLTKPDDLKGVTKDQFVQIIAKDFDALRTQNLFNRGNIETLAVYFEQVAQRAGYALDLLKADRSRLDPPPGTSERTYMPGVRQEIRRLATPEYALEFKRVLDLERKTGDEFVRTTARESHPELNGAFVRETLARHARDREPESSVAANSRYDSKVAAIQRQLDAGRPPEMPTPRGIERMQREMHAASM